MLANFKPSEQTDFDNISWVENHKALFGISTCGIREMRAGCTKIVQTLDMSNSVVDQLRNGMFMEDASDFCRAIFIRVSLKLFLQSAEENIIFNRSQIEQLVHTYFSLNNNRLLMKVS